MFVWLQQISLFWSMGSAMSQFASLTDAHTHTLRIHLAETNGPSDISRWQARLIFFCGPPLSRCEERGLIASHLCGRMCLKERQEGRGGIFRAHRKVGELF